MPVDDLTPAPVEEINDPVGYWSGWLAIGILAVLLAVAIVLVAILLTRRRAPKAPPVRRLAPGEDPFGTLRVDAHRAIDGLVAEHAAGRIDDRTLHLRLSSVMRGFASGRLGIDTGSLTLLDISRRADAAPLAGLITHYYRPSFADDEELRIRPGIDPAESVRLARTAVASW